MINQLTTLKQQRDELKLVTSNMNNLMGQVVNKSARVKLMEIIEANNEYLINLDKVIVMIEKHLRELYEFLKHFKQKTDNGDLTLEGYLAEKGFTSNTILLLRSWAISKN